MIAVFDLSSKKSFEAIDQWLKEAYLNITKEEHKKLPYIVLGNKLDLVDYRAVLEEEAKLHVELKKMKYYEISAK